MSGPLSFSESLDHYLVFQIGYLHHVNHSGSRGGKDSSSPNSPQALGAERCLGPVPTLRRDAHDWQGVCRCQSEGVASRT